MSGSSSLAYLFGIGEMTNLSKFGAVALGLTPIIIALIHAYRKAWEEEEIEPEYQAVPFKFEIMEDEDCPPEEIYFLDLDDIYYD